MEDFIDKLNETLKELDQEYDINCGGCCWVSYLLAQLLEQHKIPYSFVIEDDCEYMEDDCLLDSVFNRNLAEGCRGLFDETCIHYMVAIKGCLINPMYDTDEDYCHWFPQLDSSDIKWIYDTGSWNHHFNCSCKDLISDKLTKFFDENL